MDQAATVAIADILESEKLDAAEIERLRQAAFGSEAAWRDLLEATAAPPAKGASLARRIKRAAGLLLLGRAQAAAQELEDAKAQQEPAGALLLGRAYLEMREWKKASDAFEAGLKKAKSDFDLLAAAIEARREVEARGDGDPAEALKRAEDLAKKNADRAEAHYVLGYALEAAGEYDRAMDAYEEAIGRDPDHARALFRLAYNHELRGSRALAEDYYRRSAELNPTYANALVNYALLLEDDGRDEEAEEIYHRILRVQPTHPRARMFRKDAEASLDMYYDEDQERRSDRRDAVLRIPVTDFELSVRARNCLNKMSIRTLRDLVTKTEEELLAYKNFGETSLQEITQMLAQKGLKLGLFREGEGAPGVEAERRAGDEETLRKPITDLELSVRARNCMERLNIRTIGDLLSRTEAELLAVKNFGQTSLNEVKQKLGEIGLLLKPEHPGAPGAGAPAGGPTSAAAAAAAWLRSIGGAPQALGAGEAAAEEGEEEPSRSFVPESEVEAEEESVEGEDDLVPGDAGD